jgi:hypothetical protein
LVSWPRLFSSGKFQLEYRKDGIKSQWLDARNRRDKEQGARLPVAAHSFSFMQVDASLVLLMLHFPVFPVQLAWNAMHLSVTFPVFNTVIKNEDVHRFLLDFPSSYHKTFSFILSSPGDTR